MVAQLSPFNPTSRQVEALSYLMGPGDLEVLYGGAKGGGKTRLGCEWVCAYAMMLIERLGIPQSGDPIPVGFMGRRIARTFHDTTLETWRAVIPRDRYRIVGKPAVIIIDEAVKVLTGGMDPTEDINQFNSAELFFAFIDQAEETRKQDIKDLRGSLRRTYRGKRVPYKILFTANPAQCWLKDEFIVNNSPNRIFIPALPSDNPYLPSNYVQTLTDAYGFRPELLAAYLHGDWSTMDQPNQVIQSQWVEQAKKTSRIQDTEVVFVVCDPARFGDDEAVALVMKSAQIMDHRVMPFCSTKQLSFELARLSRENDDCMVVVESTGGDIGTGVIDELRSLGVEVVTFCPNGQSSKPSEYYNCRAEAWWNAARLFGTGRVRLDPEYDRNFMSRLESQLCSVSYEFRNGKILVESKEDIKKRIGCSPDRADALVIGLWALDKVQKRYRSRNFVEYADSVNESEYDPLGAYR